jgi:hypothetical protein
MAKKIAKPHLLVGKRSPVLLLRFDIAPLIEAERLICCTGYHDWFVMNSFTGPGSG